MPVGQSCSWCRQPGHNTRTCDLYERDISDIDVRVEGRVRHAAAVLGKMLRLKDEEIQYLSNELEIAAQENGHLWQELAARDAIIDAQDAIIAAQMDAIRERDEMIGLLTEQLRHVRSRS